jgi:Tol biopolymer transport system component
MPLVSGACLGPYEIVAAIGAGGMGEVYRARDPKLNREVALKILPDTFTADPDRVARFRREAQVLASLNHPNIGHIYGFEDSGARHALVLELVDGQTLADRIALGPIRLDEALSIVRQIADGLEAAHEQGIIHRDLKPANVKLRPDGTVKVLDFGLAKALDPLSSSAAAAAIAKSPTITSPAAITGAGVILGTAAYMSPEQARGQAVDKRTDIWAFGCVLFEMLTCRAAFSGKTVSDTIAAILERPLDWSALPASTPPNVRRLLAHCLEKDPKRRWRDIGDVRVELDDAEGTRPARDAVERIATRGPERAAWAALVLVAAAAATFATSTFRRAPAAAEVRFDVSFPRGTSADFAQLAISPDGQQLVAAPAFQGRAPLWLRLLGSTSGRTLPGTEGAILPFWSPDGKSIGFFADQKLKRIDVEGETIEVIADAKVPRGGAWQADGTILFAPNAIGPLFRVPATGGRPTIATHLETGQNDHRAPVILPDGRHFLYYARGTPQTRGVYVARLDGSESRRVLDADAAAVYAASGYLLFVRQGDLYAQAFDASRLALNGVAFRMAGQVSVHPGVSLASLATSAAGAIAYGTTSIRRTQFTWFDRSGNRLETVGAPDKTPLANPALSPDGRKVAFSRDVGGNGDIWLMDMHGATSRFTSDPGNPSNPIWSSDGRQILFQSGRSGTLDIYSRSFSDSALEQVLVRSPREIQEMKYPSDVSADGRFLLYTRAIGNYDLWYVALVGDRTPRPFLETTFDERDGQFSPDGKWVAYQSNESGHDEIYLKPFPGPGDRIQVSAGGGQQVRWGHRGAELFYVAADQNMTSVPVTFAADGAVALGRRVALFRTEFDTTLRLRQQYVVSADGQRFLINAPTDAIDPPSITLILNWRGRP